MAHVDLLITQNHGPAVLLRNEGGNKNNWLRLALKGLNDNKSAIGTKVEVFCRRQSPEVRSRTDRPATWDKILT